MSRIEPSTRSHEGPRTSPRDALARGSAHRARTLVARASPREQQQVEVVVSVVEGHGHIDDGGYQAPNREALELSRAHLAEYPCDALVLFLANLLTIFSGRRRRQ